MTPQQHDDPLVQVTLDENWCEVVFGGDDDPVDRAAATVRRLLAQRRVAEHPAVEALYVQSLAATVARLRARAAAPDRPAEHLAAAYALLGPDDLLPVCVTELWACGHVPRVDDLVLEASERFGEPVVRTLTTAAGPAERVQQYAVLPGPDGQQEVFSSVVHVWPGPVPHTAVLLVTWFASFVDGEVHEATLDGLAASLTWVPR